MCNSLSVGRGPARWRRTSRLQRHARTCTSTSGPWSSACATIAGIWTNYTARNVALAVYLLTSTLPLRTVPLTTKGCVILSAGVFGTSRILFQSGIKRTRHVFKSSLPQQTNCCPLCLSTLDTSFWFCARFPPDRKFYPGVCFWLTAPLGNMLIIPPHSMCPFRRRKRRIIRPKIAEA
jgi:hypothetical protein